MIRQSRKIQFIILLILVCFVGTTAFSAEQSASVDCKGYDYTASFGVRPVITISKSQF